jgi:catechol 2,3-dioxygenase-like lactoylglutathione lyase family enzyme
VITTFTFDHVSLCGADLDTQRDFYCRAFGLVEEYHVEWPDARMRLAVLRGPSVVRIELTERVDSVPQTFTESFFGEG